MANTNEKPLYCDLVSTAGARNDPEPAPEPELRVDRVKALESEPDAKECSPDWTLVPGVEWVSVLMLTFPDWFPVPLPLPLPRPLPVPLALPLVPLPCPLAPLTLLLPRSVLSGL